MKNLYKQKRQEGFTIIEVMIVLAIAAVILLIVLLAVPALQRNSRNTQRNNDAAQIAAAVTTCMANHNNVVAQCSVAAVSGGAVDIDFNKLGQFTSASGAAGCVASLTSACWTFGQTCNPAGTGLQASQTSREFGLLFNVETSAGGAGNPRCVSS